MTYCIADIHGCFREFMELLEKIKFNDADTLYILGDVTDRGPKIIECYEYIFSRPNIICLMGNHEDMMFKYFPGPGEIRNRHWLTQGGDLALKEISRANKKKESKEKWEEMFNKIKQWPLYIETEVRGKKYFLSHAGLDLTKTNSRDLHEIILWQEDEDFFWTRRNFYERRGPENYHCIFGHTPTTYIRGNDDCRIWTSPIHYDKTCIDSGCVYGGALAAYRLDDGEAFYVKSRTGSVNG
ncbi:MAG: metallophosphoesterase [Treponema sp.]|nr:metallophosphoesterase [Treponema sp.]